MRYAVEIENEQTGQFTTYVYRDGESVFFATIVPAKIPLMGYNVNLFWDEPFSGEPVVLPVRHVSAHEMRTILELGANLEYQPF